MGDALTAGLIVLLLLVAAFFSMAETALTRISSVRARHLAEQKRKRAGLLLKMVEDPGHYLNALALTKVLCHVAATAMATSLALERFDNGAMAIAIGAMTFLVFVLAELVPKTFAVQRTERAALGAAVPVFVVAKVLQPLERVLLKIGNVLMALLPGKGLAKGPYVTEDEIKHIVDVAEEEEEIEEEERELIHSIFEFGDTVVREVMVPRPDMITLPSDATVAQALETILEAGYSRIPMYEGDTDNIVGVLYAKDVLKLIHEGSADASGRGLARDPLFVPETKKVSELLREMQHRGVHMAIVVDEYGGTAGLVTIEDLIEEIVGEIVDEYDREEPLVEPIDDSTMRVDAKMSIDEVNELLGAELPHEEWDTVGGLVFGLTGRVPTPGECVTYDSLEFRTERVAGRRIQKVVISKLPKSQAAEG